jgi:hypothetical protein
MNDTVVVVCPPSAPPPAPPPDWARDVPWWVWFLVGTSTFLACVSSGLVVWLVRERQKEQGLFRVPGSSADRALSALERKMSRAGL